MVFLFKGKMNERTSEAKKSVQPGEAVKLKNVKVDTSCLLLEVSHVTLLALFIKTGVLDLIGLDRQLRWRHLVLGLFRRVQ